MVARFAPNDLRVPLYALLDGDATLEAIVADRIYEEVPENEVFPYLRLGMYLSNRYSTNTNAGEEVIFEPTAFTEYAGTKQGFEIIAAVMALLGDITTLSGLNAAWHFIGSWYDGFGPIIEEERENRVLIRGFPVRYRMRLILV